MKKPTENVKSSVPDCYSHMLSFLVISMMKSEVCIIPTAHQEIHKLAAGEVLSENREKRYRRSTVSSLLWGKTCCHQSKAGYLPLPRNQLLNQYYYVLIFLIYLLFYSRRTGTASFVLLGPLQGLLQQQDSSTLTTKCDALPHYLTIIHIWATRHSIMQFMNTHRQLFPAPNYSDCIIIMMSAVKILWALTLNKECLENMKTLHP